jgi:hypothetical protein
MKKSTVINALILLWFGIFFMVWATNEMLITQSPAKILIATTFKWWLILIAITAVIVIYFKNKNRN